MKQLSLMFSTTEDSIELPAIEIGPVTHAVGKIHHVIDSGGRRNIANSRELTISKRIKERAIELTTGEVLIVTQRSRLTRPQDVDGVLKQQTDGSLKWLSHKRIERFERDLSLNGWKAISRSIAAGWNGKFIFRPQSNSDASVAETPSGLRPPQLGALHAVGAHWSQSKLPATIVMPTGTGKTETMLAVLAAFESGPLLVAVPSKILRDQTAAKFLTFGLLRQLGVLAADAQNPIVGIIKKQPKRTSDLDIFESCNVLIGVMNSLGLGEATPLGQEVAKRVDALVIDEAHHIAARSWSHFRKSFSQKKVLQFTATPFREDGKLVDGQVIYSYPLRTAQKEGYFRKITFEPIYEMDTDRADRSVASLAIQCLRRDLSAGLNHLLMARCSSIARANDLLRLYQSAANDLSPLIVHSELSGNDDRVRALRNGESRIVVCVDMLGEGFDLPQLKIAALHDAHKSLAVTLQFIGRFTRTASDKVGDATAIANIANSDFSTALERLYSEDADWNEVLSELVSDAARQHAELVQFLNNSQRLDEDQEDDEAVSISPQILRPALSTAVFVAPEFNPKRFFEALDASTRVQRVWLHQPSRTLFFVTRTETPLKWSRSHEMKDREWDLFVLHFDEARHLLFVSATDRSSLHEGLAKAVGATHLFSGDQVFRTLGRISRLKFQNIGVKKHGRRNLGYAMYTGADVATALSIAERTGSVKSNLSATGWENGQHITIGCSYKGRVWSRERAPIPRLIKWCSNIGDKIVDATIDTSKIIANVLIPREVTELPDKMVLSIEWPIEMLAVSEDRLNLSRNDKEGEPLSLFELQFNGTDQPSNAVDFSLLAADESQWATYKLVVGGVEPFKVVRTSETAVILQSGSQTLLLEDYLSNYPPLIRFVDLTELDGNLAISPDVSQSYQIPDDCFESWDWRNIDVTKESIWKNGQERRDSIQWNVAKKFCDEGFDVIFDDDAPGEAADLICLREEPDCIRLILAHCKFSHGKEVGERISDVVEVCSQAIRSTKWKWKFRDLLRHISTREARLTNEGRGTRFIQGGPSNISKFVKLTRFKEVRAEIAIVQPGLSLSKRSDGQTIVLAATHNYLKETIGIDLEVICSA